MKVILLSLLVLVVGVTIIGFVEIQAQKDIVEIPSWVKGVANFWVEDKIDDGEFAEALEFLIDSDIIQLGNTIAVSKVEENSLETELPEASVQIVNMQKIIDDLDSSKIDLEKQIHELEEKNQDMMSAENREWYDQSLVNLRTELTKYYEDKINIIIDDTDTEREELKNEYSELSENKNKLWNEYQRLYNSIIEVRENTNPDDFE